jgi:hypothetical protein
MALGTGSALRTCRGRAELRELVAPPLGMGSGSALAHPQLQL